MKNVYIYSYNQGSQGAAELAKELDVYRILHEGSRFRGKVGKTVINWGSSQVPQEVAKCRVLNKPQYVRVASNKLNFFQLMTDARDPPRTVDWTTLPEEILDWLKDGYTVVARKALTSHSGRGIVLFNTNKDVPSAPLYTKYIPKNHEYRVHIMNGEVIDYARKVRDRDREPKDWKIRSHDNGFIFQRSGVELPKDVRTQCLKAFVASGLDWGAVDCIWNEKQGGAFVLEINSAPGIENSTVKSYADGFRKLLGG